MKSMRKQLLGSVFIALLVLVGCKQPVHYGGVPRKAFFKSIVSLSPSTTEMVGLAGIMLIGRTQACNYPRSMSSVPVVADLKPDYEKITQIHPDLILLDRDLYGDSEIQKLKETKAVVKVVGSDTVEGYIKDFYTLGNLISGEANINEYIIRVRKQITASQGEKPGKELKAAFIIPDASGHHMIAGTKSFQADVVRIIGATPVGPDSNKFEMLNAEFLMTQNPDFIFIAGDEKRFLADTRFANLRAVKSKNILSLDQDIALRKGSRVDEFIYLGHKHLMLALEVKK